MEPVLRRIEFWKSGATQCVLSQVDNVWELRLYRHHELIALQPCHDPCEALDLSKRWRDNPPAWPPY
jgi:hypothetical protein